VRPGRYEVTLAAPRGFGPRTLELNGRHLTLREGTRRRFTVPTQGAPLDLAVDVPNVALGSRVFGVRVLSVRFVPA
jgi:hypothetical protein